MTRSKYVFSVNDLFTGDGPLDAGLIHDGGPQPDHLQVQALVASDDCFVTLATELDRLSDASKTMNPRHMKLELDRLARVLIYLQQHYKVVSR